MLWLTTAKTNQGNRKQQLNATVKRNIEVHAKRKPQLGSEIDASMKWWDNRKNRVNRNIEVDKNLLLSLFFVLILIC